MGTNYKSTYTERDLASVSICFLLDLPYSTSLLFLNFSYHCFLWKIQTNNQKMVVSLSLPYLKVCFTVTGTLFCTLLLFFNLMYLEITPRRIYTFSSLLSTDAWQSTGRIYTSLLSQSPIHRHSGCFQLFTVINSAF